MSSRDAILASLRKAAPSSAPLPEAPAAVTYPDPVKQFSEVLASVGGKAVPVGGEAELQAELRKLLTEY